MSPLPDCQACTVAVIGLGYVGLPLAVAFATPGACVRTGIPLKRRVIGFDINRQRLEELQQGIDRTKPVEELEDAQQRSSWSGCWQKPMCCSNGAHSDRYCQAPRPDSFGERQCRGGPGLRLRADNQRRNGRDLTTRW